MPKHTHFSLPVELQFLGIPTTWTAEENSDGERVLFPAVSQRDERKFSRIADPEEIRKQFFKTELNEESALDFLNGVGVWWAVQDLRDWQRVTDRRIRAMRLRGAFGRREFTGRAVTATVESLRDEQKYWRELLRSRAKLRGAFGPPPSSDRSQGEKEWFVIMSDFGNTLPVHLEWRGKHPHAVIQPITGRELLAALAWIDLVAGAEYKVCQNPNCQIEYMHGGRKFCSWQCEHANTTRRYRKNLNARKKAAEREAVAKKKARKSLR
jgi:hypothetical protein